MTQFLTQLIVGLLALVGGVTYGRQDYRRVRFPFRCFSLHRHTAHILHMYSGYWRALSLASHCFCSMTTNSLFLFSHSLSISSAQAACPHRWRAYLAKEVCSSGLTEHWRARMSDQLLRNHMLAKCNSNKQWQWTTTQTPSFFNGRFIAAQNSDVNVQISITDDCVYCVNNCFAYCSVHFLMLSRAVDWEQSWFWS